VNTCLDEVFAIQAGDGATRGPGCPDSPSRMRSPEPTIMGEALADDARTTSPPRGTVESRATSPPAADRRMESPPRAIEAGGGTSAGDVRATTSPRIIDVDPSVHDLLGLRTWSGTSLKLTRCQEVQEHLAHRYLNLRLRA
jgi:hypothetical protein